MRCRRGSLLRTYQWAASVRLGLRRRFRAASRFSQPPTVKESLASSANVAINTGAHAVVCRFAHIVGYAMSATIFLSSAQRQYVKLYCEKLQVALSAAEDGAHVIDMDAVADAAGKDVEKPPFYYAEQSQQKQFNCSACGEFNDILGRFAYCSVCGDT
jgi:hypothetical protein